MSSNLSILAPTEADIRRMIAARVHLGDVNHDHRMGQYVHGRNQAQNHIFNLGKTWEKLMLAARAIAAVENPADVAVISGKPQGKLSSFFNQFNSLQDSEPSSSSPPRPELRPVCA